MGQFEALHISKSFADKLILDDVSLSINTNEILGLYGRNGCGKSTLLKLLFGTIKSDSLELRINNIIISPKIARQKQQLAYIPQHPFLPMNARVRDIIPMYYDGQEQDKIFYDKYIATFASRKINELSLGQRRYFEVVLVGNLSHPFIMIDEPFSMIEPLHKEVLKTFLLELKKSKGIIITDHYYNDVLDISTKNVVLKGGKTISIFSEKELVHYDYLRQISE